MVKNHGEKIRFIIAGGWNTLVGYLVFAVLYYLFSVKFHYITVLVASYILSITNAYLSYKFLVFRTKGNYIREYLRFYLIYGVSFIINLVLMLLIVESMGINPIVAQGVILLFTTAASYIGHKYYSFGLPIKDLNI